MLGYSLGPTKRFIPISKTSTPDGKRIDAARFQYIGRFWAYMSNFMDKETLVIIFLLKKFNISTTESKSLVTKNTEFHLNLNS